VRGLVILVWGPRAGTMPGAVPGQEAVFVHDPRPHPPNTHTQYHTHSH
jgi:hypothetical protein